MLKKGGTNPLLVSENNEFQNLMGTDWVQFDISVIIPEIHLVLRRGDERKLIELVVDKMSAHALKGLDYIDAQFTLHTFNILDHTYRFLYPEQLQRT